MGRRRASARQLSAELQALGAAIAQHRRTRGLTQAEVTAGSYTRSYLSKVEAGVERPSEDFIVFLEQRLGAERGSWLKRLIEADPERWEAQSRYRPAVPSQRLSPASKWAPIYLLDAAGEGRLLVPKVLDEYQPKAKPYLILDHTIDYLVDEAGHVHRVVEAWTIKAGNEPVSWFDFSRVHPMGRLIDHLTIGPIEGARFGEVVRHSVRHLLFMLYLPQSLRPGEEHTLQVASAILGVSFNLTRVEDTTPVERQALVRVRLVGRQPQSIWWYDIPWEAAPGIPSRRRTLSPGPDGYVEHAFPDANTKHARGIAWVWL